MWPVKVSTRLGIAQNMVLPLLAEQQISLYSTAFAILRCRETQNKYVCTHLVRTRKGIRMYIYEKKDHVKTGGKWKMHNEWYSSDSAWIAIHEESANKIETQ